jgi:proteasome lid subunit RPN8/RPN11
MRISAELLGQVIAHAKAEAPNECCGVIGCHPGAERVAAVVLPATNKAASPLRFEIDPREVLALHNRLEEQGLELGCIYHSHTRTAAYPSQTDISFARGWPGVEWLIVSLAEEQPQARSFLIEDGVVEEVELHGLDPTRPSGG